MAITTTTHLEYRVAFTYLSGEVKLLADRRYDLTRRDAADRFLQQEARQWMVYVRDERGDRFRPTDTVREPYLVSRLVTTTCGEWVDVPAPITTKK